MIGHDIAAALPTLRAEAESLMVVPCALERASGFTTDPDTGERVESWSAYWAGRCKFQSSREAREVTVGGQKVTVKPIAVGIPWDAPQPQVGDRVTTPAGVFYVVGLDHHSSPIMRRFTAAEHQG